MTASGRRPRCDPRLKARVAAAEEPLLRRPTRPKGRREPARPPRSPAPVGRWLSAEQVRAVAAVMRLFVEDDLANGVSPARGLWCDACERVRPAPGFIRYEQRQVCNACATEYEIQRARGLVRSIKEYLTAIRARRNAERP
jgi:hypothetical protein